jgi:hypothetical protein
VVSIDGRNTSLHCEGCVVVVSSCEEGAGRRPQSAKRQRFVELRERRWSILAAAHEVSVSRTTGNNWSRGYKTYRRGQVVGFVPALVPLAVRQIGPRFLSQDERIEIADLRHAGLSIRQVAPLRCRIGGRGESRCVCASDRGRPLGERCRGT